MKEITFKGQKRVSCDSADVTLTPQEMAFILQLSDALSRQWSDVEFEQRVGFSKKQLAFFRSDILRLSHGFSES